MKQLIRFAIIIFCLGMLWQTCVVCLQLPDYILPTPLQVIASLFKYHQLIFLQAIPTIIETLFGFICGLALGLITALCIAYYRPLSLWLLPLIVVSQAIPTFAIAPLLVIWLGFGLSSKIATASFIIFFPVTSSFYDGLRRTNSDWLALAKTIGASKWRRFYHIMIPAALPNLASGIRIAAVSAPIGAIVGEWVGSSRGLGYLMLNANARLQIDMMYAALIIIVIMALILYFSVDLLLRKIIWWDSSGG